MQSDPNSALQARLRAVKDTPRSAAAHLNLGLTLDGIGKTQEALKSFKRALGLAPRNVAILVSMAGIYNRTNQSGKALKACKKALSIDPQHVGGLSNLGSALRQMGRLDDAAEAYEKAIAIEPGTFALHLNLGNLKQDAEDLLAAVDAYQAAIKIDPRGADAHANLGEAYRRIGQGDLAIAAFQQALKFNPEHVLAHLNLGAALSQFGFLQEAASVLVRALPISNEDPKVLSQLGTCLYHLGEPQKAILALRRAIAKPENSDEALLKLAMFPTGSLTKDIIDEIKNSLARLPADLLDTPVTRFAQASYLRHAGQVDAAFALLRKANQIEADDSAKAIAAYDISCADNLRRVREWQPELPGGLATGLTPVFILGPSRSGKSTLEHLICKSGSVAPFYEGVWAGGYRFHNSLNEAAFVGPQKLETGFAARFQKHLGTQGVRFAAYTNPHWVNSVHFAMDLIPDARFIVVKRNRIDIAAEIFATHYADGNIYSYDPRYLMRYLAWYDDMLDAVDAKLPGKIMPVTAQELAQDTSGTVSRVAAHLGVEIRTDGLPSTAFVERKSVYHDHFADLLHAQNID